MSKILQLTAENVKRLRAVTIKPDGNLVVIGGDNGQGKSSVLDSIAMALGGKDEIPTAPVRNGTEKAKVIVDLGDIVVRRTFTAGGGTSLIVENKEGARYGSPQGILDKLTGKLTFDPLSFIRLPAREQAQALRTLVNLDFSAMDSERADLYAERTLVNRELEQAKASLVNLPHHADAPEQEVSSQLIIDELDKANRHNQAQDAIKWAVTSAESLLTSETGSVKAARDEVERIEKQLTAAKSRLAAAEQRKADAKTALDQAKLKAAECACVDIQPIKDRLARVDSENRKVRSNAARSKQEKAVETKTNQAASLTREIEAIDAKKQKLLADTKFPVKGLSFDENGVIYNGVPFTQASDAEQLRVSVAIAAATNPKLRVMMVKNGSLLDDKSLVLLNNLAVEHDLQVWIERVGSADKCAVIIEDGAVKGEQ